MAVESGGNSGVWLWFGGEDGVGAFTPDKRVLDKQVVDPGAQIGFNRFGRGIYDRLPFDVEAGIQHHSAACGAADRFEKSMKVTDCPSLKRSGHERSH